MLTLWMPLSLYATGCSDGSTGGPDGGDGQVAADNGHVAQSDLLQQGDLAQHDQAGSDLSQDAAEQELCPSAQPADGTACPRLDLDCTYEANDCWFRFNCTVGGWQVHVTCL